MAALSIAAMFGFAKWMFIAEWAPVVVVIVALIGSVWWGRVVYAWAEWYEEIGLEPSSVACVVLMDSKWVSALPEEGYFRGRSRDSDAAMIDGLSLCIWIGLLLWVRSARDELVVGRLCLWCYDLVVAVVVADYTAWVEAIGSIFIGAMVGEYRCLDVEVTGVSVVEVSWIEVCSLFKFGSADAYGNGVYIDTMSKYPSVSVDVSVFRSAVTVDSGGCLGRIAE